MASFNEVFERKEKKYRLSAEQYEQIIPALSQKMTLDEFGETRISSLYYDTAQRSMIARSLEKPLYKEKLRIRRYEPLEGNAFGGAAAAATAFGGAAATAVVGAAATTAGAANSAASAPITAGTAVVATTNEGNAAPAATRAVYDERVFVEMKKKFDGITYKRRVCCSDNAAINFMAGMPYADACLQSPLTDKLAREESLSKRSLQIIREINSCRKRNGRLYPSMIIRCDRRAYQSLNIDDDLRITFDTNLCYRDCFLKNASYVNMLKDGEVIMEVKCSGALPLWLTSALSELRIYPSSFSKYGVAYKMCSTRYSMPQFLRQSGQNQCGVRQQNGKHYQEGRHSRGRTTRPAQPIETVTPNSAAEAV